MAYRCKDCSYTHKGSFANGKCPACGSFNITGGLSKQGKEPDKYKNLRLVLLIGLWGLLFFMVYNKLQS